jgi:hypothetical protein
MLRINESSSDLLCLSNKNGPGSIRTTDSEQEAHGPYAPIPTLLQSGLRIDTKCTALGPSRRGLYVACSSNNAGRYPNHDRTDEGDMGIPRYEPRMGHC